MHLLLTGLILGFSIAAPVGPIGLLCIRRTLGRGWLAGLVSGLGVATADAAYGFIAAFGLTAIAEFLFQYEMPIRVVGGAFLFYIAFTTFFASPDTKEARGGIGVSLLGSYASAFALTMANPATIISFLAFFAGLGIGTATGDSASAAGMVLGVFLGSTLWWLLLSTTVGMLHRRITDVHMRWINRTAGILMAALGVVALMP
jgi:threonine/homoserine/homoserine lactone efflux protein